MLRWTPLGKPHTNGSVALEALGPSEHRAARPDGSASAGRVRPPVPRPPAWRARCGYYLPVSKNTYSFEAIDGGTRATFTSAYDSAEGLQQVLEMGVVEGATLAINQIDDLVAA